MKKIIIILSIIIAVLLIGILSRRSDTASNAVFDNPIAQSAFMQVGLSKLHVAAIKGDDKTIIELLDKGADINSVSSDGTTCLHMACFFGAAKCVRILIDRGANIEARDAKGETPLSMAAVACKLEIVELLLNRGARTDAIDNTGRTPLQSVLHAKEVLSSNAIMNTGMTVSGYKKRLDQCAEVLRQHGAK